MRFFQVIWDDDDDPDGNVRHIAEHGLTVEDVEFVLENPTGDALKQYAAHRSAERADSHH